MTEQRFDNVDRVFEILHMPYVLDVLAALGDDTFQHAQYEDAGAVDAAMHYLRGIGMVSSQIAEPGTRAAQLTDCGWTLVKCLVEVEDTLAQHAGNNGPLLLNGGTLNDHRRHRQPSV